jgi:cytidylate kinase
VRHGLADADTDPAAVIRLMDGAEWHFGLTHTTTPASSTITVDGVDPTPFLSEPEVNAAVSRIAAIPEVRRRLVDAQREYLKAHDLVMEGRDIGSVVFPETPHKFYIDASPEVRARRRAAQGLTDDLAARDRLDSSRATAPLVVAQDAQVIDSSELTIEGVVDAIVAHLGQRGLPVQASVEK